MMETRVVEEARVRAEVKRAHIRALKARFREKKSWRGRRGRGLVGFLSFRMKDEGGEKRRSV